MTRSPCCLLALLLTAMSSLNAAEPRLTEGTNIVADVFPGDGRIALDLLGDIWTAPGRGGDLQQLTSSRSAAQRPRWSPDGRSILYQASSAGSTALWRVTVADGKSSLLSPPGQFEQLADWHPSGERIVFAAARHDSGLDIWERDLASGLDYRLSSHSGDELEPVWSTDGRHLCYVLHENDRWYLMVRRFAAEPKVIIESATPLLAPSWRPDNTLITFLRQHESGRISVDMAILSDPPLDRQLFAGEDFFPGALSWIDRTQFVYTADGKIKVRKFASRASRVLPFSAGVGRPTPEQHPVGTAPALPASTTKGRIVVRAPRLYDGHGVDYQRNVDIVIEDGVITAVESQRDHNDAVVFDIGDVTVMPGLVDVYAGLPSVQPEALGPLLLAFGVTTLVTPDDSPGLATNAWQSNDLPGPRLLRATDVADAATARGNSNVRLVTALEQNNSDLQETGAAWRKHGVPLLADSWSTAFATDADLLLGTASMPRSPLGKRYADLMRLGNGKRLVLVSASADSATPGLQALRRLPPAKLLSPASDTPRRFVSTAQFGNGDTSVVVGSRPSGIAPGLATQAELLALQAAGLPPYQVLHAATGAAAGALGLGSSLGRIAAGARADLVLVAGDPLRNINDAAEVVAVVLDGRFFSTASLLEKVSPKSVE